MSPHDASPSPSVKRRTFLAASLGLVGAAAGWKSLVAAPARAKGAATAAAPITAGSVPGRRLLKCRPYLQAPRPDGITVRWITSRRSYSWVEYGERPAALDRKVVQVEDGLAQADNTVHAITLTGLQPGATYHYRISSREVQSLARKNVVFGSTESSDVFRFTTPLVRPDQVEFLVLNDLHDQPGAFGEVLRHQETGRRDCVFLNGDMFNLLGSEDQIVAHLIDPLTQHFASETPFYFGRGNHETWGDFSRQLRDYFDGGAEKFYYSLPLGPVYALVMDSGESKPDDDQVHGGIHAFDRYREAQARWLEQEVQKAAFQAAKFRVVLVHIPPFYMTEPVHASLHCRELWCPILNRAKIDLMLCGHTHKHGIHPAVAGQHHYPIVIGGGPREGRRTLIHVKANQTALTLTMKDDTGRQVGELRLGAA